MRVSTRGWRDRKRHVGTKTASSSWFAVRTKATQNRPHERVHTERNSERQQIAQAEHPVTGGPLDESVKQVRSCEHVLERPVRREMVEAQSPGERGELAIVTSSRTSRLAR